MNLLPKGSGTRPRVACEIAPECVVAGRSPDSVQPLAAVSRVALAPGAVSPGLKPGNIVDRLAVIAAVRRAIESIGSRPNGRGADISLVIPDSAVRVLLLDFDALPTKLSEALPIVRFRLKKLLPFEADDAMVSFQVMSQNRSGVRVLAVAIPRDVLAEYESVAREAGLEPGAVLPSTLAALAGAPGDEAILLVNAGNLSVTTAIVQGGQLLLHRSLDLQVAPVAVPAELPAAMFGGSGVALPLVDRDDTAGEWAAQEALPEHGRYGTPLGGVPGAVQDSPYVSPTLDANLKAELHHAILDAPTSLGTLTESLSGAATRDGRGGSGAWLNGDGAEAPRVGGSDAQEEIAHAVSVAAAYFEDTLATVPRRILSAGPLGSEALARILRDYGIAQADDLHVRELVDGTAVSAEAATVSVPRSVLAGVLGAVRG